MMSEYSQERETLYNGHKLDKDRFEDFKNRLRFHVKGKGVSDHCTSNAIFIVQARRYITGFDADYSDDLCIYDHENCETWYILDHFIEQLDDDSIEYWGLNEYDEPFLEMSEANQWDCIKSVEQLTVSGYQEDWQYINAHFTREAAQRFIDRKKHDYRAGMRIYVDSQYYAWEFNSIIEAILDGKLMLAEDK